MMYHLFSLLGMNQTSLLTGHFDLSLSLSLFFFFSTGAYPSWVQDDIFRVPICDAQVNTVVKPRRREISFS